MVPKGLSFFAYHNGTSCATKATRRKCGTTLWAPGAKQLSCQTFTRKVAPHALPRGKLPSIWPRANCTTVVREALNPSACGDLFPVAYIVILDVIFCNPPEDAGCGVDSASRSSNCLSPSPFSGCYSRSCSPQCKARSSCLAARSARAIFDRSAWRCERIKPVMACSPFPWSVMEESQMDRRNVERVSTVG